MGLVGLVLSVVVVVVPVVELGFTGLGFAELVFVGLAGALVLLVVVTGFDVVVLGGILSVIGFLVEGLKLGKAVVSVTVGLPLDGGILVLEEYGLVGLVGLEGLAEVGFAASL